jgi:hypothetical protein
MKNRHRLLLNCALPLVTSLIIYVLFRPKDIVVNQLIYDLTGTHTPGLKLQGCGWLVYNLPGALWLYAFLSFSSQLRSRLITLLPLCLALGIEAVQLLKITDGTFDVMDVLFYLLAWLVFMYVSSLWKNAETAPVLVKIRSGYKVAFVFFILIVFLSDVSHH